MKLVIEKEIDANELISAVFDNLWSDSSSWVRSYKEVSDQELVTVTFDNPVEGPEEITRDVTAEHLVEAYANLIKDQKYHCGTIVPIDLEEWDSCVSDYVLQYALFGELVYGQLY